MTTETPSSALPPMKNSEIIMINNQPNVSISSHLDPESLETCKNMQFTEKSIRRDFLRKVYFILMLELLLTAVVIAYFITSEPMLEFLLEYPLIILIPAILNIVIILILDQSEKYRRDYPINFILLGIFTLSNATLLGWLSCLIAPEIVFVAVLITTVLCLSLSLFAVQTKYDFTVCGAFVIVSILILLIVGIVTIFWSSYLMEVIYSSVGATLACFYFVYDTQLMLGGTHKYSINPEEYILAALVLYMDISRIFVFIIRLFLSLRKYR